jgi:hypothetical protein
MCLYDVFAAAADGSLAAQDGQVEVVSDASICLRAALAAGYSPIGGEVLLPRVRPRDRP